MPNVNHWIAFNCDLFLSVEAPEDATSEELETLVMQLDLDRAGRR